MGDCPFLGIRVLLKEESELLIINVGVIVIILLSFEEGDLSEE